MSRFGKFIGKQLPNDIKNFDYTTESGIWSLRSTVQFPKKVTSSFFGTEYGNWNGERIIFSTSANVTSTTSFDGLDGILDSNTNRLYDAYMGNNNHSYRTGGYHGWATRIKITNPPGNPGGRSATIGYFNNTAYLYMGANTNRIDIYLLSNLSHVATWTVSGFTSQVSGLAYDGDGGMYAIGLHARRSLFRINTLQPITQTLTPTAVLTSLPADTEFGLCYNGTTFLYRNRTTGDGKVYECNIATGAQIQTYTPTSATGYGIHIDYANKHLYTGGLNDATIRRFNGI